MAGYIGSRASVVSSGAEHKKVFAITTTTTALTGLSYTPTFVHVFHNGVRLVDGTDYTATNGTSITLTSAAESGDEVVVISYATFQVSDTVSASAGGTFAGDVNFNSTITADGLTVDDKIFVEGGNPYIAINDTDVTDLNTMLRTQSGVGYINTINDAYNTVVNRLSVNHSTGSISFYEDTGTTPKFFWDASAESLGIGTVSPADVLHIVTPSFGGITLECTGATADPTFKLLGDSGNYWSLQQDASQGDSFQFRYNNSEKIRIDSSGNVGIGTSPTAKLHVNTGSTQDNLSGVLIESTADGSTSAPDLTLYKNSTTPADGDYVGALWFYGNDNGLDPINYAGILGISEDVTSGTEDGALAFVTTRAGSVATEAMRIDSSGRMVVGLSAAFDTNSKLQASGAGISLKNDYAGNNNNWSNIRNTATSSQSNIYFESGNGNMTLDHTGNLLVGTTVANGALSVQANSGSYTIYSTAHPTNSYNIACRGVTTNGVAIRFLSSAGSDVGSIDYTSTATSYTTSSDYRLKENVAPMQNALDTVAQLNPVTYTWKADGSAGQGFIAHELQAVVPDCVTGEKDAVDADGKPQYQGVDTSFLVGILTKAIQEQQTTIAALEAQNAAFETRLAALEAV